LLQQVSSRDSTLSRLQDQISSLENTNVSLESKIQAGFGERRALERRQKEAEEAVEKGIQMRTMIAGEVTRLTDKVSEAGFEKTRLEEEIFSREGEKEKLLGDVSSLESETGHLNRSVEDMASERDRLVDRVITMHDENKELEECVIMTQAERSSLERSLVEAHRRQQELAAKLTQRQERFERQLAETGSPLTAEVLAAGEAKLSDRGIPVAEVDEAEAQLRSELAESSKDNRRLMSELRGMIGQLDDIQVLKATHGV